MQIVRNYIKSRLLNVMQAGRDAVTSGVGMGRMVSRSLIALLGCALCAGPALAADEWPNGVPPSSIATSLPNSGDPGGMRKWLFDRGLSYSFVLTSDVLGNVSGGIRTGAVFQGKLETIVKADLEKMFGLRGLSFFANAFQIHNTGGIRGDRVGSFNTISNIEALPSTRLSELWLEQSFGDTFSVRFGQLAADTEFFISDNSTFLMNSDWPAITAQNLPSGGPASPFSTPGIRLKFEPNKQLHVSRRAVQRRSRGSRPRGPAAQEPLRAELPRAGSAAADGRGAVPL